MEAGLIKSVFGMLRLVGEPKSRSISPVEV